MGTIIHVASGTYSAAIATNKDGTTAAHIRYISDAQYGAKLVGTSSSNCAWTVRGQYTDIVGFDFDGSINTSNQCSLLTYAPGSGGQVHGTHTWFLSNK